MKKDTPADLIKAAENKANALIRVEAAKSLGVEPEDLKDDDIYNYMKSTGGDSLTLYLYYMHVLKGF
jgi:hypothetical protein